MVERGKNFGFPFTTRTVVARNTGNELNEWIMAWVAHQLPRDPAHLFERSDSPFISRSPRLDARANPNFLFGQPFIKECILAIFSG